MDIQGTKDIVEKKHYSIANKAIKALNSGVPPHEAKILRLIISQIEANEKGIYEYTCTASRLCKMIGVSSNFLRNRTNDAIYPTQAKMIANRLEDTKVSLLPEDAEPDESDNIHLFYRVQAKAGRWRFILHPDLYPYVSALKEWFCSYNWEIVKQLDTTRGIRFYELLACHLYESKRARKLEDGTPIEAGEMAFSLDYMREYFCIKAGQYQRQTNFIERIIKPAENDLLKAGISVTHRTVLSSHSVKWLVFRMSVPDATQRDAKKSTSKKDYGTASYEELEEIQRMIDAIK